MIPADKFEFQAVTLKPRAAGKGGRTFPANVKPPKGDGWMFTGFDVGADGLGVVIWARETEGAESIRQRLLGECVELLGPLVLKLDRSLTGLGRRDGQQLLDDLKKSSPELVQLVGEHVAELAKAEKG